MDLAKINEILNAQLPQASVTLQQIPDCKGLSLYLLNPEFDDRDLSQEICDSISDDPPYWIFCWASGRALAQAILQGDIDVRNQRVLDFGAGSGVVAIAAKMAGARSVVACDIDPLSRMLIALNQKTNGVEIDYVAQLEIAGDDYDVVFAADVLYEAKNLVWLDELQNHGKKVIVADSRQKNLLHPSFNKLFTRVTTSFPDFAEAKTFNEVTFYQSC